MTSAKTIGSHVSKLKRDKDLNLAVRENDVESVRRLLQKGANPIKVIDDDDMEYEGCHAFDLAALFGYDEILQIFIDAGWLVSADVKSAMSIAIQGGFRHVFCAGHISTVRLLLNAGLDPLALCDDKITYLMFAACAGDVEMIELFLSLRVNINSQDTNGETALDDAVRFSRVNAVECLLNNGAFTSADTFKSCSAEISAAVAAREARIAIMKVASQLKTKD